MSEAHGWMRNDLGVDGAQPGAEGPCSKAGWSPRQIVPRRLLELEAGEEFLPRHTNLWGLWADSSGGMWSYSEDLSQERNPIQNYRIPPGIL